jgi:hypothetical protein
MTIQFYPDELDYVNATIAFKGDGDTSFLGIFCEACLRADDENYELLRPVLAKLMEKYPADPARLAMERIDSGRERKGDVEIVRSSR